MKWSLLTIPAAAVALAAPSWRLGYGAAAVYTEIASIAAGAVFGGSLALVTRTLKPWAIYLLLMVAVLAAIPLTGPLPAAGGLYGVVPPESPAHFSLEVARYAAYGFAAVLTFARLGHHRTNSGDAGESLDPP